MCALLGLVLTIASILSLFCLLSISCIVSLRHLLSTFSPVSSDGFCVRVRVCVCVYASVLLFSLLLLFFSFASGPPDVFFSSSAFLQRTLIVMFFYHTFNSHVISLVHRNTHTHTHTRIRRKSKTYEYRLATWSILSDHVYVALFVCQSAGIYLDLYRYEDIDFSQAQTCFCQSHIESFALWNIDDRSSIGNKHTTNENKRRHRFRKVCSCDYSSCFFIVVCVFLDENMLNMDSYTFRQHANNNKNDGHR
jgi:hypothetical protein